jgi:hypothetical protein
MPLSFETCAGSPSSGPCATTRSRNRSVDQPVTVLRPAGVLLLFAGMELQEWQGGPCRAIQHACEEEEPILTFHPYFTLADPITSTSASRPTGFTR